MAKGKGGFPSFGFKALNPNLASLVGVKQAAAVQQEFERQRIEEKKDNFSGLAGVGLLTAAALTGGAALGLLPSAPVFGGAAAGTGAAKSALLSTPAAAGGGVAAKAGALMPAAVPESAATLAGWGLTETAPGVFAASGATGYVGASSAAPNLGAASRVLEAPAAKSGILGTGVTTSDALGVASLASSAMTPKMPPMPDLGAPPERGEGMPENRTQQMALRAQELGRRATAARATRSDNEADVLGATYGPRRRGAARQALYGAR